MKFRGTAAFAIVLWLSGSACRVYKGDSLANEQQREPSAAAAPTPRDWHNFEVQKFPTSTIEIAPRRGREDAGAEKADPPEDRRDSEPPVAGGEAPRKDRAPDTEPDRRADMEIADDDAGPSPERTEPPAPMDAGLPDLDAGTPQRIATGQPSEVDAGKLRPVARVSSACRGERGFETDGRCYFVLNEPVSWNVGRDRCYEHNAHLASVTSEEESDLVASFDLDGDVWIGFSRFGAAHFSWLTNESGSFSNWQKGAPRAMQESGALIVTSTGKWTNRPVPELHPALCETERKASHHKD